MDTYTYWSPQQIVKSGQYPFSMGQLRHLLLYRQRNGLHSAVRKIGKRLVLRMDLFDQWIDNQTSQHRQTRQSRGQNGI